MNDKDLGIAQISRTQRTWVLSMTALGVVLLLSVAMVSMVRAQQAAKQDFGSGGLFSYVPPEGWTVSDIPGLKFKVSRGEPANGFAPNIVIVDEAYNKSLEDYVKDNITTMEKLFQGQKILSQSDFTTSDGTRALKMVTERDDPQVKKTLRQTYYFFDAGNKKLVAACTRLAGNGDSVDSLFDAAMKTFTVKKNQN
jgi:hypothetical protein